MTFCARVLRFALEFTLLIVRAPLDSSPHRWQLMLMRALTVLRTMITLSTLTRFALVVCIREVFFQSPISISISISFLIVIVNCVSFRLACPQAVPAMKISLDEAPLWDQEEEELERLPRVPSPNISSESKRRITASA
jgi:hypothetical protein